MSSIPTIGSGLLWQAKRPVWVTSSNALIDQKSSRPSGADICFYPAARCSSTILNPFDRYIGIPWVDRGRSIAGCDCYGLLRLALSELRGIELPSRSELYATAADRHAIACLLKGLEEWDRVAPGKEQPFDGVLMRQGREIRHIGLVVEPGRLLHVDRDDTSRIERYTSPPLSHRLVGFYRYRG